MGTASDEASELAAELCAALGAERVDGLERLSGGASRHTWRFSADLGAAAPAPAASDLVAPASRRSGPNESGGARVSTPLIAQCQRAGYERDMLVEAAVVRTASTTAAPVPNVRYAGLRPNGQAMVVLDAVEGETIARKILRDDRFAAARGVLVEQFGAALAAIHTLDGTDIDGLPEHDQIEFYTEMLDQLAVETGQAFPVFELVRRWLLANKPKRHRRCLVHGDFRLGNVIVDDHGLAAVIDWELAHRGDPMEDLGWLCVKAWRFGAAAPVAGLGEYDELFAAYEAAGGQTVDPDVVRWWEVLGTWKWGIMCMLQASVHLNAHVRSHEHAAIGRRVCENEHDLFLALEGRWRLDELRGVATSSAEVAGR